MSNLKCQIFNLPMPDWNEILCERCGSDEFVHVSRAETNVAARTESMPPRWFNKCLACGHEGEYLPTPDEIRRECRRIRRQQGLEEAASCEW